MAKFSRAAPVTPGVAGKVNNINGTATIMQVTTQEWSTNAELVLPKNMLVRREDDNCLYISDGVKKLKELTPVVDTEQKPLNDAAYAAVTAAFSSGSYRAAANAVVTTGEDTKLDDALMKFIEDGGVKVDYLSDWIDPATGIIRLEKLPEAMRTHITYVADISARNRLVGADAAVQHTLVFVVDATDDPSVEYGSAVYVYVHDDEIKRGVVDIQSFSAKERAAAGYWVKISEPSAIDINLDDLKPTTEAVEAAGAVMYNHMVLVQAPTLTDYVAATTFEPEEPEAEQLNMSAAQGTVTVIKNGGEAALGLNLDGTISEPFTVTVTPSKCKISGFLNAPESRDTAYSYTGTLEVLKAEFKNAKVEGMTENGTVTFHTDADCAGSHGDATVTVNVEEPVPATVTVSQETVTGTQSSEVELGVSVAGKQVAPVTLKLTMTNCQIKGLSDRPGASGDVYTKTGSVDEVNAAVKSAKIVIGAQSGNIKVDLTGGAASQNKTITVTKQ